MYTKRKTEKNRGCSYARDQNAPVERFGAEQTSMARSGWNPRGAGEVRKLSRSKRGRSAVLQTRTRTKPENNCGCTRKERQRRIGAVVMPAIKTLQWSVLARSKRRWPAADGIREVPERCGSCRARSAADPPSYKRERERSQKITADVHEKKDREE